MKKVVEELHYDGATIQRVHEMLGDRAFREKVCDYQRVLRHSVRVDRSGQGLRVEIDQFQAARSIPSFAKKLVGDEINIVQTEDWTSPEEGSIHVTIPGMPIEAKGTALLTEATGGTTQTVNLNLRVSIPLMGGKIEGVVADLLSRALRAEHEVGVQWLAGQR